MFAAAGWRYGKGEDAMKKSVCLSGVAAALLGLALPSSYGQIPLGAPTTPTLPPGAPQSLMSSPQPTNGNGGGDYGAAPGNGGNGQGAGGISTDPGISTWLAYPRPWGCCCPTGKNGPIGCEVYIRSGASVPVGSGVFASVLNLGWDIEGGVRTLLFNPAQDAAWTADLSITNIHYRTTTGRQVTLLNFPLQVPTATGATTTLTIPSIQVTPAGVDDTTLNLAFGREWYLWGTAECHGEPMLRVGCDFGGRWGNNKLDLREIRHKTGAIEGFFTSIHSDVEIPCSCCIIQAGFRLEYGYTFSNILKPTETTDLQTFNFMFMLGTRY
jgi:hypothetical protein